MLWISLLLLYLANPVLPLFQVLLVSPALGLTSLFLATWDSYREAVILLLPHLFLLIPPLLPFSFSAGLRQTSVTVLSFPFKSYFLPLTISYCHSGSLLNITKVICSISKYPPQAEIYLLYFPLEALPENLPLSYLPLLPPKKTSSLHSSDKWK